MGNSDIVNLLLSCGAKTDISDPVLKRSALSCACIKGHIDVCEMLIQAGADVRALDALEVSSVEHSACNGFVECVKLLINSSRSQCVERVLVLAAYNGHKQVRSSSSSILF